MPFLSMCEMIWGAGREFCCEERHSWSLLPPCGTASLLSLSGISAAQGLFKGVTVTCKVSWASIPPSSKLMWGEQACSGYGQSFQGCLPDILPPCNGSYQQGNLGLFPLWIPRQCEQYWFQPGALTRMLLNKQWGQFFASPADCRPWKEISRPGSPILPGRGGTSCLALPAQKAGCKYLQGLGVTGGCCGHWAGNCSPARLLQKAGVASRSLI